MICYTFTVNTELAITSWDKLLEVIHEYTPREIQNTPYYTVLPRILVGDEDAVLKVIREGHPLLLKGYRQHCIYGVARADITIQPVQDRDARIIGAEVHTVTANGCAKSRELKRYQTLIDIGKMSATLAHGVRNPLNAIKGAVVYLKDKYSSDATFVEFADIIDEEIDKLDEFITRFLSTSLVEIDKVSCDVNSVLEKIVKLTSLQAQSHNIHFHCEFGQIPPVHLDSFHMESAILNVVNNALDAMCDGGRITLRTSTDVRDTRTTVVVDVCDAGPGVPEGRIRSLLNPPDDLARDRGRGFGLFITRELVQHHGGTLEIMNNKDKGTTVRLRIPVDGSPEKAHAR